MDDSSREHEILARLKSDLLRVALRDRWDLGLTGIGWLHLAYCLVYQRYYSPTTRDAALYIALWITEVAATFAVIRGVAGRGWHRSSPLAGVVVRVWATFFILCFSVASLNGLTGFEVDWFKLVWCTLSSFGFATMAWLLSSWFLVPAFQMYFTGLLMLRFPHFAYLIHGISWCLALNGIGLLLANRRRRNEPRRPKQERERERAEMTVSTN